MDNVGVISTISTTRGYEDRVAMLDEVGRLVGKHLVITKDYQSAKDEPLSSEFALLDGADGLKFLRKAYGEARRFQALSPNIDHWIVHDYVTAWAGPLLELRSRRSTTSFLSLVSPSVTILRERGWRMPSGKRRSLGRETGVWTMLVKRCVLEYAGALASDVVVTNSDMISREVAALPLLKAKSIHTMPTEVDTSVFHPAPSGPRQRRPPRILYVTGYVGVGGIKDISVLLRAFADLEEGEATLALVGRVPSAAGIREIDVMTNGLVTAGRVTFPGLLDRRSVVECYRDADLFVSPSFYEGSPRVVKEAMACGLPAIVSDIPGNRLIDPDGRVLRFYKPGSVRELASRMRNALEDRPSLAHWGLESARYVQRFSTTEIARNTVRLYEEHLNR